MEETTQEWWETFDGILEKMRTLNEENKDLKKNIKRLDRKIAKMNKDKKQNS